MTKFHQCLNHRIHFLNILPATRIYGISIGACRAVQVPGQDLAAPHLMCNYRKRILSLHCMLYVRLCTHMLYRGLTRGFVGKVDSASLIYVEEQAELP